MWGKREQIILWIIAYVPLLLIMIYRFIDAKDYFKKTETAIYLSTVISKVLFDVVIISIIMLLSFFLYRKTAAWFLKGYGEKLKQKKIGKEVFVRRYEKPSANDYSFFLMTLIIPLVSIDHSSIINLMVSFIIISIAVIIFVQTDFLSPCPIFFVANHHLFKAVISDVSREVELEHPSAMRNIIVITKDGYLDLNFKFRIVHLVADIYYLVTLEEEE